MKKALLLGGTGLPSLAATKSGTSFFSHSVPFQATSALSSFQGLPCGSHEARL